MLPRPVTRPRFVALAFAVVALSALSSACKPREGGRCRPEGRESCTDERAALACQDGVWRPMSCRGPLGCSKATGEPTCDQSLAVPAETCNLEGDVVCASDERALLRCTGRAWATAQKCLGARGCAVEGKSVTCDNSLAEVGDACGDAEDFACSLDGKAALACRDGKFVHANACKGPSGCRVSGEKASGFKIECDDSVANAGDPCEKDAHFACSADMGAILVCKDRRFRVDVTCAGAEKCKVADGQVGCR